MNKRHKLLIARTLLMLLLAHSVAFFSGCDRKPGANEVLQLNWFHDPTFAGEYELSSQRSLGITVREGGPAVKPLAEVISGRATYAVVGIDLFLQYIGQAAEERKESNVICIFADFQRNAVGWVVHPDVVNQLGLAGPPFPPKESNDWLASQLLKNSIRMGDKRGTETTSVWVQWKNTRQLPESVRVEPVGFDPKVVLQAPHLAYPVYLNEEPFKLTALIGREVPTFDPAVDGVRLYGNVIVCRKDFADGNPDRVRTIQRSLRSAWEAVRSDIPGSVQRVNKLYKGVSDDVLTRQLNKTVDFVFDGNAKAGQMDTNVDGRFAGTLTALREAGIVSANLSWSTAVKYVLPPE